MLTKENPPQYLTPEWEVQVARECKGPVDSRFLRLGGFGRHHPIDTQLQQYIQ